MAHIEKHKIPDKKQLDGHHLPADGLVIYLPNEGLFAQNSIYVNTNFVH